MLKKYLSEKELMEIPTTNSIYEKYKEIIKKYPILKGLEEKLSYEQFANLFFLIDHLYCYEKMWEELKFNYVSHIGWCEAESIKEIEQKYLPKEK